MLSVAVTCSRIFERTTAYSALNLLQHFLSGAIVPEPHRMFPILAVIGEAAPLPTHAPEMSFGPLIYAFVLLFLLFLLINLDRRFREYISRAMIRPFNFFADIRDQRLIPNAQTTMLAIILSGSLAGCIATVVRLFFALPGLAKSLRLALPDSLFTDLSGIVNNYTSMLAWFTLISLGLVLLLTAALRFAAIFVRGRILLGDTYNVTVWALLPAAFLLPYDLIAPRMDMNESTMTLSIILLGVLFLWSFYRLLKGTGVLFDVYPTKIYLYGTLALAVVVTVLYFYLRENHVFENFSFVGSVIVMAAA